METKFHLELTRRSWSQGTMTTVKSITPEEIEAYSEFIKAINSFAGPNTSFNWFGTDTILPDKWDGERYVIDIPRIKKHMKDVFNYDLTDADLFIKFVKKFVPRGADRIDNLKVYKVEEVKL